LHGFFFDNGVARQSRTPVPHSGAGAGVEGVEKDGVSVRAVALKGRGAGGAAMMRSNNYPDDRKTEKQRWP